jgi:hypothetical protein
LGESWGEAKGLLAALAKAADPTDAKLRLRSVLRRMIAEMWLLVVPVGIARLAAVQVYFAEGDKRRDYVILHMPSVSNGKASRPAKWSVKSLVLAGKKGELDLRMPADAKLLEAAFADLDVEDLTSATPKETRRSAEPRRRQSA